MLTALIISFRESLEVFMLAFPLLAYLAKIEKKDQEKYLYGGLALGFLASVLGGTIITLQSKPLAGYASNLLEGSLMIFLSLLVLYNIVIVNRQASPKNSNEDPINVKAVSVSSLFLLPFLTVLREGLEITIFVLPNILKDPFNTLSGVMFGILSSFILSFIVYKTAYKLNITLLFNLLSIFLVFIGASMFGEGLAELFPELGESAEMAGKLIFAVPTLYLLLKNQLKKYIKKLKE